MEGEGVSPGCSGDGTAITHEKVPACASLRPWRPPSMDVMDGAPEGTVLGQMAQTFGPLEERLLREVITDLGRGS